METQKRIKTGGRKKGTPNKTTSDLRAWVQQLIDDNRPQLKADLEKLEPKERWMIIEKLMQYTMPKIQSIEANIDFTRLTDEQLDRIINNLNDAI